LIHDARTDEHKTLSKQFSQLLSSICAATRFTQAAGRKEDQVCIL
jgi:hypothetical protein